MCSDKVSVCDKRIYLIDNIKALLIFLVVLGHLCEYNLDNNAIKSIYCIIYSFHMPAFVLCSGVLAAYNPAKIKYYLLYVYFLFQTVCILFERFVFGESLRLQYTTPYWVLWYIFVLAIWLIILPLFKTKLKKEKIINIALVFILAVLIGFDSNVGKFMSLSRFFVYFPYFIVGYYINFKQNKDMLLNKISIPIVLACVGIVCLSVAAVIKEINIIDCEWFYNSKSYFKANTSPIFRISEYIAAFAWIILIFKFMPKKRLPVVSLVGQHSINIFLLHIFIVKLIVNFELLNGLSSIYLPVFALISVLTVLILGSNSVDFVMKKNTYILY